MARKPTRFWDPLRRAVARAQERATSLTAARHERRTLADVRPRLQHYLRAMYGDHVAVEPMMPRKGSSGVLRRALALLSDGDSYVSENDASHIRLPVHIAGARTTDVSTLEQYRVLAVQHAERIQRASATHARSLTTDLERDLFELAESVSIDAHLRATQPGLGRALDAARTSAIAQRKMVKTAATIEQRVELMVQSGLRSSRDRDDVEDAQANATWARATARMLASEYGSVAAQAYRRVRAITVWGTSIVSHAPPGDDPQESPQQSDPAAQSPRSPSGRQGRSSSSSSSNKAGPTASSSAKGKPSEPPPESNVEASEGERADEGEEPERSREDSEKNERSAGEEGGASSTGTASDAQSDRGATAKSKEHERSIPDNAAIHYPEWDCYRQDFHPHGAFVRLAAAPLSSPEWAENALRDHSVQVHQARRQFERFRSQRVRLRRQVQGEELDLEACVEWMVDRRLRIAPSDRLYTSVRPGRRELAITLLIDTSASTNERANDSQRVIDVERIAALIATAAFDGLGDDYSILTFASAGATQVRMHTLKAFGEKASTVVHQRIGAIAPGGTTRLGAAIRHATAQLATHPAPYRLLLILSDGKPYDYDWYFVDYAVADARHATIGARLQGIHPFCITVDRAEGEAYLPTIFGSSGYRVVRRPEELPRALLSAVQRMIR